MIPPISPCGMGVDYARSCYETTFRFFSDSQATTTVRYFFTDKPMLPIVHKFGTRNWLSEGEEYGPGEVDGASRKWVDGKQVGSAPGDHYCGTQEQWLGGMRLPPDPPIPVLADGTPACCFPTPVPGNPMFGSGGQGQGYNRAARTGQGGQRQGGRGAFNPALSTGGQQQGGQGTVAHLGGGGSLQGGNGRYVYTAAGGQVQGGSSLFPYTASGGQLQGGQGLAVELGSGGQQEGGSNSFLHTGPGANQFGAGGLFASFGHGSQGQGGAGVFSWLGSGGQQQGGAGGFVEVPDTGTIITFGGSTIPSGYHTCDGSAISRTTFAALFAAIGTTWGAGNGTTTFNVPDLRGRVLLGAGTGTGLSARALGATGGEENHTLTLSELAAHSHVEQAGSIGSGSTCVQFGSLNAGANTTVSSTANSGGGASHNTMQPWACVNYIIKD